jgi:hypothetical protein
MKPELSHSHGHEHEHEAEPQYGLPEKLPDNERILWQGSPDWRTLARYGFHVRKLVAYFVAMIALRMAVVLGDGAGLQLALVNALWLALLAAIAIGVMAGVAYLSARTTVYTITTRRVVMRVGIVLRIAFNLPYKRIASAGFRELAGGKGDIPLALLGNDRIAYLNLWPHARPWHFSKPEPMLRSVPHAQEVAGILSAAWAQCVGQPAMATSAAASVAASVTAARTAASRATEPGRPQDAATHSGQMGVA